MKKNLVVFFLSGLCLVLANCNSQKKQIAYSIPDEYTGKTRETMIGMLDQGQKLFRIHCSKCHGIFTKGKDSIPNFSKTQIENYKMSVVMDDPKNHAVAKRIRPYDLDLILQFLSFRKTAGKK